MSGIAGIFKFGNFALESDRAILIKMLDALKHGDADGKASEAVPRRRGIYEGKNCLMGQEAKHSGGEALSSIRARPLGQEAFNEDKSIAVIYNGEIYNHKELKEILISKGHKFHTEIHAEVIAHAWEEWGEGCFSKFNGMFAIAVFDSNARTLLLARDRVGMKPLYFRHKNDVLLWASEIKSLLLYEDAAGNGSRPDYHAICDFITFQNTIDEKTFFKGILKLLPGHFIKASCAGTTASFEIKKYWDFVFHDKSDFRDINEIVSVYENTFTRAVKRHLPENAQAASYLSGGFDSSSIAFFASRFLNYPLKTFTGYFPEGRKYDERGVTRIFKELTGVQNVEVPVTPEDFKGNIEKVIYHLEEPAPGSGALGQYIVAGEAAKHAGVILAGDGGDELFAGYQGWKAAFYKDLLKNDFVSFLRFFWKNRPDEILKVLYFSFYPLIFGEVRHGLFIMFNRHQRSRLFTPEFLSHLGDYEPVRNLEDKYLKHHRHFSNIERTSYLYLKTYLPALLIQGDKMGAAHSIESRMPICDNEMLELSAQIPYHYKLYNNNLKYLPKAMMRKYLPEEFYKQPKMGFPTPISIWFRRDLKDFVYNILTGSRACERNIFNIKYIKNLLNFHLRFGGDTLYDYVRANKIYSLLSVELWFRTFIDK